MKTLRYLLSITQPFVEHYKISVLHDTQSVEKE